jgi:CelD/BcsL family acetyltransferase involved in cellulose biosynthesis
MQAYVGASVKLKSCCSSWNFGRGLSLMSAVLQHSLKAISSASPVVRGYRGGANLIDQFAEEWRRLALEAVDDQPFFHPEWIRAYLRAFCPNARLLLVTVHIASRLALIFPLVEEVATFSKIPVRRLRAPVNSTCGRFDVLTTGAERDVAIRAAWQFLKELKGWDLLQLRDSLEGSTVSRIADLARTHGFRVAQIPDRPNPYITVPSRPEALDRMPPNSKLRSQLRQIRLRVRDHGILKFSRTTTADRVALERFYKLEASGWKAQRGSCVLNDGTRPFYDEVAAAAARAGYLSLFMLELNDVLIAAHMSLTYRDRCYSPKVAYNEDYKQFAPGHLIIAEILRYCMETDIRAFDITGQDQPWKMKWTSEARPVSHHFVFNGPIGALAHAVGSRRRYPEGSLWHSGNANQGVVA